MQKLLQGTWTWAQNSPKGSEEGTLATAMGLEEKGPLAAPWPPCKATRVPHQQLGASVLAGDSHGARDDVCRCVSVCVQVCVHVWGCVWWCR